MYKVLLDLDGVVADFIAGACKLHKIPDPYLDTNYRGDDAWDIFQFVKVSPQNFWAPMGRAFWRDLPKTDDADQIVLTIEESVGAENVCFLTSPCRTRGCVDGKREWCEKYYPHIPVLFSQAVVDGTPPKDFVSAPNHILVDDCTLNVVRWRDAGGLGFIYPRPWNRNWMNINPVGNLRELLNSSRMLEHYRYGFPKKDPVLAG